MVGSESVLAIVPARGGSKGLPSKNIRPLGGHPLIAYSVATGLGAETIDRVIISTDDKRIAEVGVAYGAEAPFLRPDELATDTSPDLPLFEHALNWLRENEGYEPSIIVQIRPTSPFRPRGFVDSAVRLLQSDSSADSVRAVTQPKNHPSKMWVYDDGDYLRPLLESSHPEPYNLARQLLPEVVWQTGHVDVIRTSTILEKGSLTGKLVRSVSVDSEYVVDIDRLEDLHFAEYMLKRSALDIDWPVPVGGSSSGLPPKVRLAVLDFDGTMTDDRVWVDETGREAVACSRSDGMGLSMLTKAGIEAIVISTEKNSVVARRCEKLGIAFRHGVSHKLSVLQELLADRKVDAEEVVYVGNDVNDLDCMRLAGFSFAPADARPEVKELADRILTQSGGRGAIREVCELLIANLRNAQNE